MVSLWIPLLLFTSLVQAQEYSEETSAQESSEETSAQESSEETSTQESSEETSPTQNDEQCKQTELCTRMGGTCMYKKDAPEDAKVIKDEDGKKIKCNGEKKCFCYKSSDGETPSAPTLNGDCNIPGLEHSGNDLVLPPPKANSTEECKQICADNPGCNYFTYYPIENVGCSAENISGTESSSSSGNCNLKDKSNPRYNNCSVSGSLTCPEGETASKVQRSFWQNDWDGVLHHVCPISWSISRIRSYHDNHREDRRWRIDCKYTFGYNHCSWSGYVNSWDNPMLYVCPSTRVIKGVYSYHSNHYEDRIWQFYCCGNYNRCYSHCYWTGHINYWDAYMDFSVPSDYYVVGFESVHDNGREDRRWRVLLCKMKTC